jgi:hypothetical protein
MRYYQTKQFEMLTRVAAVLKRDKKILSERVPALEEVIDDYVEWMDQLFKLRAGIPIATPVATGQKRTIRQKLEGAILKLTGVLRAHQYKNRNKQVDKDTTAHENEGGTATALADYTSSGLMRATAENLYHISGKVIQEVKKIKPIRQYGLTADDIKKAEHCFEEFAKIRHAPSQSKKDTATRNEELAMGVKEGIANLENVIDPLMRIATEGNRELTMHYKGFRKVMVKGQGRMAEKEERYRRSRKRKKR